MGAVHRLHRLVRRSVGPLALALGAALLAGCEGVSYLGQAAWGQARLVMARRPLEAVLADPATPEVLRTKLGQVAALREFAVQDLAMRRARGFASYAATGRESVVWNVVAAPEFSVKPLAWCFPVAGCVSYRGYFARERAESYAAGLRERGYETWVHGVAAYSTLGWFDDPVLDTWIMRGERALAALVFHELAHQLVYAPGDTAFSEAFARVVEREGVRRWLQRNGRAQEHGDYLAEQRADHAFAALVDATRERLAALYAEPLAPEAMRVRKQQVLDELRTRYARASREWPPAARFERFMNGPLDNARLATVANYEQRVPALVALLAQCGGELPAFYEAAAALAALDAPQRQRRLQALEGLASTSPAAKMPRLSWMAARGTVQP